jgi:hypothetical protein
MCYCAHMFPLSRNCGGRHLYPHLSKLSSSQSIIYLTQYCYEVLPIEKKNVVAVVTGLVPRKDRYSYNHIKRKQKFLCFYRWLSGVLMKRGPYFSCTLISGVYFLCLNLSSEFGNSVTFFYCKHLVVSIASFV